MGVPLVLQTSGRWRSQAHMGHLNTLRLLVLMLIGLGIDFAIHLVVGTENCVQMAGR